LVLAALAAQRGVDVWVLEHDALWAKRLRSALGPGRRHLIHLCAAPLRSYGDFDWYDAPWPQMPNVFRLVVCDGPPETTRGGRYGVVPLLQNRLSPDTVLLLDNATRPKQAAALERWQREAGATFRLQESPTCAFAVARFSAHPQGRATRPIA